MLAYGVLVVYFGIYSYINPDPAHCYYIEGLDTTGMSKAAVISRANELDVTIQPGYPVDVAHLFRVWFMWGFWGSIFQLSIITMFLPLAFILKKDALVILRATGLIFQFLSCLNGSLWFLLGCFWRFSRSGRTASGEKL